MKNCKHWSFVGFLAILVSTVAFVTCDNGNNTTHTHEWGNWSVTTVATCTTVGSQTRICISDSTHTEIQSIAINPTVHIWGAVDGTSSTCTTEGNGTRTCTLNLEHIKAGTLPIDPTAHSWGDWTQTTPPTFTLAGIKTRKCNYDPLHIDAETQIGESALNESIEGITAYLATANEPVSLPIKIHLGTMTEAESNWQKLHSIIATVNKNVKLDLSACTINGTDFTPYDAIATGNNKIIEIILPNSVTSVGGNAFANYNELESAILPTVINIRSYAFANCKKLKTVSLSATTILDGNPFYGCTALTTFNLIGNGPLSTIENGKALIQDTTTLRAYPSASGNVTMPTITNVRESAFDGCNTLENASFPIAVSIGQAAFLGCSKLESVSFPSVSSIGWGPFMYCYALKSITLGSTAPILAFNTLHNLTPPNRNITIKVPIDATGYDADWQNEIKSGNGSEGITLVIIYE